MEMIYIMDCFDDVEVEESHDGYFYKVSEVIKIIILGCLCGLKNVRQIHQWAVSDRVSEFLKEKFAIERIPCYYWMLCLLKIVKPESLNDCFKRWVSGFMPDYKPEEERQERSALTVSVDGKSIRSTGKMRKYQGNALHIVSAQLAELGLTFAQQTVDSKSNEIPAAQALLKELDIRGCLVTADAMNCQTETAKIILEGKGDYLLCAKGNHDQTMEAVERNIKDEKNKDKVTQAESHDAKHGRDEKRTAYVIPFAALNLEKLCGEDWPKLACIGAIHREFETKTKKTDEWHYYISSRELTAEELLHAARMEWTVETMHWLLDVRFEEDKCRVEDTSVQRNLNMLRKLSLNLIRLFKERTQSKKAFSHIMLDCLLDPYRLVEVISGN